MSLNRILLAGAALAVLSFVVPSYAADDHYPADHGAPEGHAQAHEDLTKPPAEHMQHVTTTTTHTEVTHVEQAAAPTPAPVPESHAHWGYGVGDGSSQWGSMDDAFKTCAEGKMQSPVNISEFMQQDLPKLKVAYADSPLTVGNNGHTLQVKYEPGSKFMSAETIYDLVQFNFRTPSEHYIDGAPYPMELQLIHTTPEGQIAIVAVMIKLGMHNDAIQQIWDYAPAEGQHVSPEGITIKASDLLPSSGTYYTYTGSLTTPPCSEGVNWHVLQEPIEISLEQLSAFQSMFPNNARPVQPMHGRIVKGS